MTSGGLNSSSAGALEFHQMRSDEHLDKRTPAALKRSLYFSAFLSEKIILEHNYRFNCISKRILYTKIVRIEEKALRILTTFIFKKISS